MASLIGSGIKYAALMAICAVLLFPIWLMVSTSFSPARGALSMSSGLIPKELTLANYKRAFALPFMPRWVFNTMIVLVLIVVVGVFSNGAAGYVFSFARFKGLNIIFWTMMTPIFVTRYVLIISQFIIVGKLHMGGLPAVIAMAIFWPSGIFLFRNYFKSIPGSLLESARIDGASEWTILTKVVLPLSKPMLGMAIVFMGMSALGDYMWQMLNLQDMAQRTYLVGLAQSVMTHSVVPNIGYDLAVGTLLFLPYLVLFSVSSRYFIGGLTGGALKE
jgi:multiple sugar transport system permease protein